MKQKLSLSSIKNALSRAEMKSIMAGSGPCVGPQCFGQGQCDAIPCAVYANCNKYCHACVINPGGGGNTCV